MATLQPQGFQSERRHRSRSPGVEKLRLDIEQPRRRSRSRTPKPYNPDSPKRYGPNESRSRKPPISPTIEDAGFEDAVCMRGKIEQKPMIIPASGEMEPSRFDVLDDSSASMTPPSSEDERKKPSRASRVNGRTPDSVEVAKVDATQKPQANNKELGRGQEAARGRQEKPKLDTSFSRDGSEKLPRLERERSPYSSGPRNTATRDNRFSTENLLSPSLQSPRAQHSDRHRSHSQNPPYPTHEDNGSGSDRGKHASQRPLRPGLDRRASAMPELGRSTPPNSPVQVRKKSGQYSSDESEHEAARHRATTTKYPTSARSRISTTYSDDQKPQEKSSKTKTPASPPRTPTASDYPKSQGLNREALLNGAAASLTSLLDDNRRRASPRSTPQVSPNSSPYPSPPRTPPEQHRTQSKVTPKHDSPISRSSSPLSAVKPSLKASTSTSTPTTGDTPRPERYQPRSRATSPMPTPRRSDFDAPKIDVRSPSPLPAKHSKSMSQDVNGSQTPSRYLPSYAVGSATLQPARPDARRQRSMSSSEGRDGRPVNLTINTPMIHQSDIEYLSPTSENVPSALRNFAQDGQSLLSPTAMDRHLRDSVANSSQRSHSAVPGPDQATRRSSSAMPTPSPRPRSKSSAPQPDIPYSEQKNPDPTRFPPCPHPKVMTDYEDWYSLKGCDSFVICRECRSRIFGRGFERQFRPFDPESAKGTTCIINDPWIRMACFQSIARGSNDLTPVVNLASENEGRSPCPQRTPAQRDWYYLRDPEADENLADFRVCSHCAHSIYTLFPVLDRAFQRAEEMEDDMLLCSIRSADPARFGQYVTHCEKAQQAALKAGRKRPDMSDFIWYHKKETVISECTKDQVLIGRDWHQHPHIPQCTVCEECYYETIRPEIKNGSSIAQRFTPVAKHINDGVSCALYSPRMKEVFKIACEDDDMKYLEKNVMTRRELQIKIMAAKMAVQKHPRDKDAQYELDEYMAKWRKMEKEKYAERD